MSRSAIIVGAGIVGLASARALALRGYEVTVFERNEKQVGASIRNFGMIWAIGQPPGLLYERALLSRSIWKTICTEAGIWHSEKGSLHLAYHADEWQVMEEYAATTYAERNNKMITAQQTLLLSDAVQPKGLLGALWSEKEMIVEARDAIGKAAAYLKDKYSIRFHYNTAISEVKYPSVRSGNRTWQADEIYVCSGADFETLYPELFLNAAITKCKLQMMRIGAQPDNWSIGPSLGAGLSLIHYNSFSVSPSLPKLRSRYEKEYSSYLQWGIHVMVSQNGNSELTIGDSHEYGLVHDPFDKSFINTMIIDYLKTFALFKKEEVIQSWHGIYPKLTNGQTELILVPEQGVTIINGLGGSGMTLSFGLAEQYIASNH